MMREIRAGRYLAAQYLFLHNLMRLAWNRQGGVLSYDLSTMYASIKTTFRRTSKERERERETERERERERERVEKGREIPV